MDLTLERDLVAAALKCLGRRAREQPPQLHRAAEHLDDARRLLELAAYGDLPSSGEDEQSNTLAL